MQFFIDTLIPTEKDNQKIFWFRAKNTVNQARFRPHGPKTTPELGYNLSRLLKKVGRWFNTLFQCIFRCWVDWNWFQDPGRYSKFINGQIPTKNGIFEQFFRKICGYCQNFPSSSPRNHPYLRYLIYTCLVGTKNTQLSVSVKKWNFGEFFKKWKFSKKVTKIYKNQNL